MPETPKKKNIQTILTNYNTSIQNHPSNIDNIFTKHTDLLGNQPVYQHIKSIREDRKIRKEQNQLNELEVEKDRLEQQNVIANNKNTATKTLNNSADEFNEFIEKKASNNRTKIQNLQDTINTRDKIIYLNNKDAYNKQILIKTLLIVLLLAVCLAVISMLYYSGAITSIHAFVAAVLVTVVFIYKIIRTYYWRGTVHAADEATEITTAGLRSLFNDNPCPSCNTTDYCTRVFEKANKCQKDFCKEYPNNVCCIDTEPSRVPLRDQQKTVILTDDTDIRML